MALVIADTGPIIALAQIDQLAVLQSLFGEVVLPNAVWVESQAKPGDDSERIRGAVELGWLRVIEVACSLELSRSLHDGEIEALELARNEKDSLLLLDDQLARRAAVRLGLNFIGTVRVLALAEEKALISSAEACIKQMQQFGYRVSLRFLES